MIMTYLKTHTHTHTHWGTPCSQSEAGESSKMPLSVLEPVGLPRTAVKWTPPAAIWTGPGFHLCPSSQRAGLLKRGPRRAAGASAAHAHPPRIDLLDQNDLFVQQVLEDLLALLTAVCMEKWLIVLFKGAACSFWCFTVFSNTENAEGDHRTNLEEDLLFSQHLHWDKLQNFPKTHVCLFISRCFSAKSNVCNKIISFILFYFLGQTLGGGPRRRGCPSPVVLELPPDHQKFKSSFPYDCICLQNTSTTLQGKK